MVSDDEFLLLLEPSGSSVDANAIYVAKTGNDTTGDGSFENISAFVASVFVTPVGSVSAANVKLDKLIGGVAKPLVANKAVDTTTGVTLYERDAEGFLLAISPAGAIKVTFSGATNGNQFLVTVEYLSR